MRPGFWRKCRVCFRWCRISVLLLVLVGLWVLFAGRSFDVVWTWADRSFRRILGFVFLSLAAGYGAAEAVARFGYGQPLFG